MNIIKRFSGILLAGLLLVTATGCGSKSNYSLGTGNIGGNYYSYGNALSGIMQSDSRTIDVKSTAGSAANLRLLQNGFLDMAIVQNDVLYDAYNGLGSFEGNKCDGVRALAGLYIEECQIVVRKDSDIESIADLYGKKISVGEEESGVMQNAKQILQVNGIDFNMITPVNLSFSDAALALKNGEIEAFFCTAGSPTTAVLELSKEMEIRLISLDEVTCQKLISKYPSYSMCTISKDVYEGMEEDVTTVGVKAVLVVSNKLSDEFVEDMAKCLFENAEKLQYATSASALDIKFATDSIAIPFHDGAYKWYQNNGITVNTSSDGTTEYGINAGQD